MLSFPVWFVIIQLTKWKKIFPNYLSDRGLYPEYIKNAYNLIIKRQIKAD